MFNISNKRLIARLDLKNTKLIKGLSYEGYKVIGEADLYAEKYYNNFADEIIILDTVASLQNRKNIENFIRHITKKIFIPITVCGGLRNEEDISNMLKSGADKIGINSAVIKDVKKLKKISETFGNQCIVLSVEAVERKDENWEAFYDNGREPSGRDVVEWCIECEKNGIGEILVTNVNRDGTKKGLDRKLIKKIVESVNIPVIGSGGTSGNDDIVDTFEKTNVSAIAVGASLHSEEVNFEKIKKKLI